LMYLCQWSENERWRLRGKEEGVYGGTYCLRVFCAKKRSARIK